MRSPNNYPGRARWEKEWKYDVAHGRRRYADPSRYMDVEPVRLHVLSLRKAGWSLRAIGAATNVHPDRVGRIARNEQRRVSRPMADRLLSLRVDARPPWLVSKVGAVRRVQALMTLGWSHETMLQHSGVHTRTMIYQSGEYITRRNHDKVAKMYRELSTKMGPSAKARRHAAKVGYVGPMEWDDIDNDEAPEIPYELVPVNERDEHEWRRVDRNALRDEQRQRVDEENIDHAVVWRVILERKHPRHLTRAESAEIVRILRASKVPEAHIEKHYGINPSRHAKQQEEEGAA